MAHALLAYYSVRLPKNQYPYVSMHTEFVHSDEKSDYAIRAPELCGIAYITFVLENYGNIDTTGHERFFKTKPFCPTITPHSTLQIPH